MTPHFLAIKRRMRESADVASIELEPTPGSEHLTRFQPGQFNMLYVFGVGEIPISISGDPSDGRRIVHTIRDVGAVSEALFKARRGELVGVRGPFGQAWPVEAAAGADVVLIAGGIGLAPLRPALYSLLQQHERFGRLALLYGARDPKQLLFRKELLGWLNSTRLQVRVSVDHAGPGWTGDVGVVTKLLPKLRFTPNDSIAMICGPEVMIRFTADALNHMGVSDERIYISAERNMKCAFGHCGHCQLGPYFVCKDGPVFRMDVIRPYLRIREI